MPIVGAGGRNSISLVNSQLIESNNTQYTFNTAAEFITARNIDTSLPLDTYYWRIPDAYIGNWVILIKPVTYSYTKYEDLNFIYEFINYLLILIESNSLADGLRWSSKIYNTVFITYRDGGSSCTGCHS